MNRNLISRFWRVRIPSKAEALREDWNALTDQACLLRLHEDGLQLKPAEVHVWCLDLDSVRVEDLDGLSDEEIDRANHFRSRLDRQRSLACRGVLREMLGRYAKRAPAEISFAYGPNGKPSVATPEAAASLHFNVSHSGELALYAFSQDCEIGVDVERIRQLGDMDALAQAIFSKAEMQCWNSLPEHRKSVVFFDSWTKKEAALKARGTGLADGFQDVTVLTDVEAGFEATDVRCLLGFCPKPDYCAALATRVTERSTPSECREDSHSTPFLELQTI